MRKAKRMLSGLLLLCLLLSIIGPIKARAAEGITISNGTFPGWVKKGDVFILKGIVNSDSTISSLTAGIYDSHKNTKYEKTVYPNSKSYNLKGIDSAMRFDKLGVGTYIYRIVVKNDSGTHTIIRHSFIIYQGQKDTFDTGFDTSCRYQICMKKDSDMVLDVAGYQNEDTVYVQPNNGQETSYWYLEPYENSCYLLRNAATDCYMEVAGGEAWDQTNVWQNAGNKSNSQQWWFVKDGDYYKIICRVNKLFLDVKGGNTAPGTNVQICNSDNSPEQRFLLKKDTGSDTDSTPEPTPNPSTLDISGANTVPTLSVGQKFSLKGTITSNYDITYVTAKILKADGSTVVEKTIYPNQKSASLSGTLDYAMTFNKLSAGNYYYAVTAGDASGNEKQLLWQSFAVKAGNYPEISYRVTTIKQKNWEGCSIASVATCLKAHGVNATYNSVYKQNKNSLNMVWSRFNMNRVKVSNQAEALKGLYDTLKNKGVVVVGRSNGKSGSAYRSHFSVIVAYKGNAEKLEMKGFIVQDVYDGKSVNFEAWAKRQDSKWRNYYYYTK